MGRDSRARCLCRLALTLALAAGAAGCMVTDPGHRAIHPSNAVAAGPPAVVPPPPVIDPSLIAAQFEDLHLLNVGDQVEIRFPYRPNFDQVQIIRDDGRIALPLIEPVVAGGKTPEMLRDELQAIYRTLEYDPVANRDQRARRDYVINVEDKLEIQFDSQSAQAEFNDTVTVRPDGKISLARIGTVVAEGKTPETLEKELIERYSKFLREPKLVVIVRNPTSNLVYVDGRPTRLGMSNLDHLTVATRRLTTRLIYVTGEVRTPGFYPYQVPMTALRAIIASGGSLRTARLKNVVILRNAGSGPPIAMSIDLRSDHKGGATTDFPLRPYDIVVVPKTPVAKVKDFLEQYLYELVPATRNSSFLFFYNLNPQGLVTSGQAGAGGAGTGR